MTDQSVLTQRLVDAEDALHRMLTGAQEVEISYEDHQVTYSRVNEPQLRRYIRELQGKLGLLPAGGRSRQVTL